MRLSGGRGLHMPGWPSYNTWPGSWWGGCSPGWSPPGPGLKHKSAPGPSVITWCWWRLDVPDVLHWIQVWGTGRPFHSINAFIKQELLTQSGPMRPSEEPRVHCTSMWSHRSEDLILVPDGRYGTSGCTWRCSRHYWPTAEPVLLDDVSCSRTFSVLSPDSVTSVTCSVWPCSHPWTALGVSGESADLGVLW